MVKNYHSQVPVDADPQQTQHLRRQADALLQHLIEGKNHCDRRLAELGQRDAMKFVTGRSAIEDAIATTRNMIRDMDALLEQMDADLAEPDVALAPCELLEAGTGR